MLNEAMLRSFLLLAQEGSYTKTARILYLSQQAVSKQMSKLEEDLGCSLFRRENGKLVLTEAGHIYYDAFSRMDDLLIAAKQQAGQLDDSWDSHLVIGVLDAMNMPPLTRELNKRFLEMCPNVSISYKSNSIGLMEWLKEEKVDVVFSMIEDCERLDWLEVMPLRVLRERMFVAADHPLATDDASYLDFVGESVFYTRDVQPYGDERIKWLKPDEFPNEDMVATKNFLASTLAVEQMQGVMFVMEGNRLEESNNFRTYPTGRETTLVLAYRADSKKRCVRKYVQAAKKMFSKA